MPPGMHRFTSTTGLSLQQSTCTCQTELCGQLSISVQHVLTSVAEACCPERSFPVAPEHFVKLNPTKSCCTSGRGLYPAALQDRSCVPNIHPVHWPAAPFMNVEAMCCCILRGRTCKWCLPLLYPQAIAEKMGGAGRSNGV